MAIRLEQQLRPLWIFLGYNGDPGVISQRDVVFYPKAKRFCVEMKCLLLVVYKDAGQVDSDFSMPSSVECEVSSSVEIGHRSLIAFSGAPSNQWSFNLPSRLVRMSPATSKTSRCCEIAWREELMPCFMVRRALSSKSD